MVFFFPVTNWLPSKSLIFTLFPKKTRDGDLLFVHGFEKKPAQHSVKNQNSRYETPPSNQKPDTQFRPA